MTADPICRMPSIITAKASSPARGMSASFRMIPITSPCATAMPMTPCATERMVAPASARKSWLRSATTRDRKLLVASNQPWRCGKQEARQRDGDKEFERSNAGTAGKAQHRPGQRFQMRGEFAQQRAQIGRGLVPEGHRAARPTTGQSLTPRGRRRNRQRSRAELRRRSCAAPPPAPEAKPGRRADDDAEIDERQDGGREFRTIAEHAGKPVEDRIERDRQHHAPGEDRNEGPDDDERPVDQQRQQREPDRKLDLVLAGEELPDGAQGGPLDV